MITVLDGKQKVNLSSRLLFLSPTASSKQKQPQGKWLCVYPPWVQDLNPTASRTQNWQTPYFLDLSEPLKQTETLEKFLLSMKKGLEDVCASELFLSSRLLISFISKKISFSL